MRRIHMLAAHMIIPFALYSSASTAGLVAEVGGSGPLFINPPSSSSSSVGPITASFSESSVTQSGVSSVTGLATADYGYNKAAVLLSSGVDNPNYIGINATARSYWSDQFIVNSDVSSGFMKVGLDMSAFLTLDPGPNLGGGLGVANNSFQYSLMGSGFVYSERFGIDATSGFVDEAFFYSGGFDAISSNLSSGDKFWKQVTVFIPFTTGLSFSLASDLYCSATATHAEARCDAGNSVYWAGILDVLDVSGAPIEGWSIESASQTDYTKSFVPNPASVPEPATWVMLIVGLIMVGGSASYHRITKTGTSTPQY